MGVPSTNTQGRCRGMGAIAKTSYIVIRDSSAGFNPLCRGGSILTELKPGQSMVIDKFQSSKSRASIHTARFPKMPLNGLPSFNPHGAEEREVADFL